MVNLFATRKAVLWLVLVALTIVSLELFPGIVGGNRQVAAAAVIVIAFIKVRIIGLDYMEIRNAPRLLRALFEAWTGIVLVLILVYAIPA
ncbi:cytochrome C oxidase subunit IV family protein [Sphingobium sp. sgz301303]|uniref:cytochrome C oxidase subunit IV family protein n=1 Tax=Sphingobium sp. sgz301303 TaxID=3342380 RepID=UPI0035A7BE85